MNLTEAVIMGKFCGMNTVKECIANIHLHYWQAISYTKWEKEMTLFSKEVNAFHRGELSLDWTHIESEVKKQDKEYEDWMEQQSTEDFNLLWEEELNAH